MKKLLFASFFFVFPGVTSAADLSTDFSYIQDSVQPSHPQVVGHLELSGAWVGIDDYFDSINEDFGYFEGAGRVNIGLVGNWNLELETGGFAFFDDSGASESGTIAAAHLWSAWQNLRLGIFGGAQVTDDTVGFGGVEGEIDIGNVTLGAEGAYAAFSDCSACNEWFAEVWANLYLTPNTAVGGSVYYFRPEQNPVPTSQDFRWGASASIEQRFAGTPLSAFGFAEYENQFDAANIYVVGGGFRVFLDQAGMTLQEHDRLVPFAAP